MTFRLSISLLAFGLFALPASSQSLTRSDGSVSTNRAPVETGTMPSFNPDHLTQSSDESVITPLNSVACTDGVEHTENSYLRRFLSSEVPGGFTTKEFDMAIESASSVAGTQDIFVNVYSIADADAFLFANMTLEGTSGAFAIPDGDSTFFSIPVVATIAAGSGMVVEIFQDDATGTGSGELLWIGSNAIGQSAPSYIASASCGIFEPTDMTDIGFPGMMHIMGVDGTLGAPPTLLSRVRR